MYGVILWSDQKAQRAVIWCEDHGKLAYFNPHTDAISLAAAKKHQLGVGDLIKFHVREWCTVRRASKVELIAAAKFPDLAGGLAVAKAEMKNSQTNTCGNVVAFRKTSERSRRESA
ncbi:MAG: hypothetical protein ACPG4F_05730 [Paracoccaceae bacterium]